MANVPPTVPIPLNRATRRRNAKLVRRGVSDPAGRLVQRKVREMAARDEEVLCTLVRSAVEMPDPFIALWRSEAFPVQTDGGDIDLRIDSFAVTGASREDVDRQGQELTEERGRPGRLIFVKEAGTIDRKWLVAAGITGVPVAGEPS